MSLPINNNQPLGATRVHGDANGVVNVNIGMAGDSSANVIIATGLTKQPTAYKIVANVALDMGEGSAVETILRSLQVASTVVMYQVTNTQLNVLVEAQGFGSDSAVANALPGTATSTVGSLTTANVLVPVSITTVSSAGGFQLA